MDLVKKFVLLLILETILIGKINLPNGLKILDINFRDKQEGWEKYSFLLSLAETFKSLVVLSNDVINNIFLKGFFRSVSLFFLSSVSCDKFLKYVGKHSLEGTIKKTIHLNFLKEQY